MNEDQRYPEDAAANKQMTNWSEETDEKLMRAYQEGQELAFAELYRRHSPRVYGYLKKRLYNKSHVEDVFQATFMKFHRARSHYDPLFPFAPWLFTVCKSVLIDFQRSQARIQEDLVSVAIETAVAQGLSIESESPDLSVLPANQRLALELRYSSDFSFEEIASRLETSPSNVRQMVSRAVRKLRVLLDTSGRSKDETE